jgi:hypothetical protein
VTITFAAGRRDRLASKASRRRRVAQDGPRLVHHGHQLLVTAEVRVMPAGETAVGGLDGVRSASWLTPRIL